MTSPSASGAIIEPVTTPADVLRIAAAEIGTVEQPVNRQKYSTADGRPAESWCADFAEWVLRQAGIAIPVNTYGNASALVNSFGNIHIAPQPGDLVGYHFPGEPAGINHVGIVESVGNGMVTSIEGNTTSGDAGVQSNGGGVYRRTRPFFQVVGFGRPAYKESPVPDRPRVNAPIVGGFAAYDPATGNVKGYALLGADGGVFCFGEGVQVLGTVEYVLPAGDDWSPAA